MNTTKGFTLIEVLIAMLVLAIGLLGLASLQTLTLRNNLSAYNRGQAIQLLYDMSDRMRANNCTSAIATAKCPIPPNPLPNYVIANSNSLNGQSVNTACTTVNTNNSCTAATLATNDLIEWNNAITATLPMGEGIIETANGVYTLRITWDDNRDGTLNADDPTFSMGLQL